MHVERRPRRRLGSYRRARLGCKAADHESGRLPAAAGRAIMAHNSESLPPDLTPGRLSESPATRLAWLSHRTRRADRAAGDIEREGSRFDPIRAGILLAGAHVDGEPVLAAEVVGHLELECGRALRVGGGLGDRGRGSLPAGSGHAVADDAGPVELVGLARLKAFAAHHHRLLNA